MNNEGNKRSFVGTRKRKVPRTREGAARESRRTVDKDEISLEQALSLFVRVKENEEVRPRTIRNYIDHVRYLTDFMEMRAGILKPKLADLSADMIHEYITYLRTERRRYEGAEGRKDEAVGLSPHTINIRLRTLRTMCRFWTAERLFEYNPMENIKLLRTNEEPEVRGFNDAELKIIFGSFDKTQFADWRDYVLCALLLDTGLRPGEATGLTVERVDFTLLTIYVPSTIAKNRRNREVPMSKESSKLLRELYEESLEYFGETEHIFNNAYGDPFTADAFRKRLNRRKERLGIERMSPNMFRHTFCRDYLLNGGDLFTLQKIVDHADIETTRKYVQMDTEHVRSQHEKFSPARRIFKRRR